MLPGLQGVQSSSTAAQMKRCQVKCQIGLALGKGLRHARQPTPHGAVERRRPEAEKRVANPLQRCAVICSIQDQGLPRKSPREARQPYT